MKKITVLLLSLCLLAFSACKKKSNTPSIVGAWKLANITGMVIYNSNPSVYDTVTYSYSNTDNIYTRIEDYYEPFEHLTITYQVNNDDWSFNADGTYSISESYSQNNPVTTLTNNATGAWEYLGNTHANDGLILTGASSALFPNFSKTNNTYRIQTLNSSTLVLTVINNQTSSTGTIYYNNIVITFSKK